MHNTTFPKHKFSVEATWNVRRDLKSTVTQGGCGGNSSPAYHNQYHPLPPAPPPTSPLPLPPVCTRHHNLLCYLASDASADLRIPLCSECGVRDASRHCGNCVASYCSTCDQVVHARGVSLRSHARVPVTQSLAPPSKCGEHPSEVIRYYCPRDHTLLCSECAVYGSHKEHSIVSVTAAVSVS